MRAEINKWIENPVSNKGWLQLIEFCINSKVNQQLDTFAGLSSRNLAAEIRSNSQQQKIELETRRKLKEASGRGFEVEDLKQRI